MKTEDYKTRARRVLSQMTLDDLYVALGRYCGYNNELICEKKYGIALSEKDVNDEIFERLFIQGQ